MEILQLIEHKLTLFGIAYEHETAEIALAEIDQCIKNYCHIDCIPQELLFTRANMVTDLVRYSEANKPAQDGQIKADTKIGPLTSIKAGDVQYNFGDGLNKSNLHNSHVGNLDEIVMNYTAQLNEFRRLV